MTSLTAENVITGIEQLTSEQQMEVLGILEEKLNGELKADAGIRFALENNVAGTAYGLISPPKIIGTYTPINFSHRHHYEYLVPPRYC